MKRKDGTPIFTRLYVYVSRVLEVPRFGKGFETPVVRTLNFVGEAASRKFFHGQMIAKTFTARSFSTAPRIRAITVIKIFFFLAFHNTLISCKNWRNWTPNNYSTYFSNS